MYKFGSISSCSKRNTFQRLVNYLAFQSFDFDSTRYKVIPETCRVH